MSRLLFLLLLIIPQTVWAAQPEAPDLFSSGIKLFAAMAVVIGLMLLLHVLNKKGFRFLERRHAGSIKIIETRPLGGRRSLCLVEVEGRRLLLGLGGDRVNVLERFGSLDFEKELQASVGETT